MLHISPSNMVLLRVSRLSMYLTVQLNHLALHKLSLIKFLMNVYSWSNKNKFANCGAQSVPMGGHYCWKSWDH